MINELRKINEKLKKKNSDQKYVLIEKILNDDKCFFKMDIETSYAILRDLEICENDLQSVYEKLIDIENYHQ